MNFIPPNSKSYSEFNMHWKDINRKQDSVYYLRVSKKSLTWYELRLMHRTFGNLGMTISIHYRIQAMMGNDGSTKRIVLFQIKENSESKKNIWKEILQSLMYHYHL